MVKASRKKLHVLFVTNLFPISGGRRPEMLVKYFSMFDVNPIVLTSDYFEDVALEVLQRDIPQEIFIKRTFALKRDPCKIFSKWFGLPELTDWVRRFFFFPDFWVNWVPGAILSGLKILKKHDIDVILSTSPPESTHLIGYFLHAISGLPWIADFQDMWTQKKINFHPATIFHQKLAEWLEKKILSKSRVIIANTDHNAKIYKENFKLPANKVEVIQCGFDPGDLPATPLEPETKANTLVFGYLGYFDKPGFPYREILNIFYQLRREGIPVELEIIGYISDKAISEIEQLGYADFVRFHSEMPNYKAIPFLQKRSDILLAMLYETSYSQAIVPLKIYSYMKMNRKVMAIAPEEGEVAEILRKTRIGQTISIHKPEKIKQFIRTAYSEKQKMGRVIVEPDISAVESYNVIHLTERLSKSLWKVAHGIE